MVADTVLLANFTRIDYQLTFKDTPVTVTKSLRLVANNNAGTVTTTVSERQGGSINVAVDVDDGDAVNGNLQITNNEAYDIELNFLRAITP